MSKSSSHIAVLLICSILVLTCWQSFTVINFYAHQDEIEAEYCENLERPELECHGQCHLEKELGTETLIIDKKTRIIQSSILIFQSFESLDYMVIESLDTRQNSAFKDFFSLTEGNYSSLLDPPEFVC